MYYSGLDLTNNLLTGVTRAGDGTTAAPHVWAPTVEGQAYLMIVDPTGQLDGQAIGATPQAYFITYDLIIWPQVNVNASLGAEIRSTTYFLVDAPEDRGNNSAISDCRPQVSFRLLYFQLSFRMRIRW